MVGQGLMHQTDINMNILLFLVLMSSAVYSVPHLAGRYPPLSEAGSLTQMLYTHSAGLSMTEVVCNTLS